MADKINPQANEIIQRMSDAELAKGISKMAEDFLDDDEPTGKIAGMVLLEAAKRLTQKR